MFFNVSGILSGEKQRVDRGYDFVGVLQVNRRPSISKIITATIAKSHCQIVCDNIICLLGLVNFMAWRRMWSIHIWSTWVKLTLLEKLHFEGNVISTPRRGIFLTDKSLFCHVSQRRQPLSHSLWSGLCIVRKTFLTYLYFVCTDVLLKTLDIS